jgi:hypothetical protein
VLEDQLVGVARCPAAFEHDAFEVAAVEQG